MNSELKSSARLPEVGGVAAFSTGSLDWWMEATRLKPAFMDSWSSTLNPWVRPMVEKVRGPYSVCSEDSELLNCACSQGLERTPSSVMLPDCRLPLECSSLRNS